MRIKKEDLEKAAQVKAIIEKEFQSHCTDEDLARQVGTNEYKLKVSFKFLTSKSIYEFYTDVRMERAKYWLENTEFPIAVIAKKVGLDKSNFIKQFKKLTNKTPYTWRRDQENNDEPNE